ncbi:hypothetical protein BH24PSE2_BH24PSE2_04200 [soil metagenome]
MEFERITPVDLDPHDGHHKPLSRRGRRTLPAAALATMFALLLIALAAVVFYLPRLVEPPAISGVDEAESVREAVDRSRPVRASSAEDVEPWRQAMIARERKAAQDILAQLLRKQFELEERAVEQWAAEDFAAAREQAEAGDALFRSHDYAEAAAAYTRGHHLLDALLERVTPTLAAALDAGDRALARDNGDAAREAYELALAIEPRNPRAQRGLDRVASLDEVLALMQSGRQHEEAGRLEQAAANFRQAATLDADLAPARTALAQVEARLADTQFSEAMSAGFAALQRDDYGGARAAFAQARRLKPSAPGPAEGLTQVELAVRLDEIASHREQAAALEAEERWSEAAEIYEAALELDADLAFAQAGLRRSRARAELTDRLDAYLNAPERMSSEKVHAAATALVQQLSRLTERGSQLESRIARLEELLKLAVTPVRVRLESDNQTQVVVHKVGELGTFESRELELRPGTYTVVGSCAGYRDVRRELEISAGNPPAPVVVRCEDKI